MCSVNKQEQWLHIWKQIMTMQTIIKQQENIVLKQLTSAF